VRASKESYLARAIDALVGYVRVAFTEEDWAAIPDGAMFAYVGQNRLMHHEDPSTAIQGLPAAGADHRHRHAPRPAGTVDSRA
jgi:hypothetical protein